MKEIERIRINPSYWSNHIYTPTLFVHWEPRLVSFGILVFCWQLEVEIELQPRGRRKGDYHGRVGKESNRGSK